MEEAADEMCNPICPKRTWVLSDHRIAAKGWLLTTRAAKWATVQVGTGRTVLEVAGELDCDWHTINDAVTTYASALLKADRKRLNRTTAIGLDETNFIRLVSKGFSDYATTVALNNLVKRIQRIGFGFRNSRTTESGLCSTPAGRIGAFWDRWWSGETADPPPESDAPEDQNMTPLR